MPLGTEMDVDSSQGRAKEDRKNKVKPEAIVVGTRVVVLRRESWLAAAEVELPTVYSWLLWHGLVTTTLSCDARIAGAPGWPLLLRRLDECNGAAR